MLFKQLYTELHISFTQLPMAPKKSTKVEKKEAGAKTMEIKGVMARHVFFSELAAASNGLSRETCQKIHAGMRKAVARHLREYKMCCIPNLVKLRVSVRAAHGEYKKMSFGKMIVVKPQERARRIHVQVQKPLRSLFE